MHSQGHIDSSELNKYFSKMSSIYFDSTLCYDRNISDAIWDELPDATITALNNKRDSFSLIYHLYEDSVKMYDEQARLPIRPTAH